MNGGDEDGDDSIQWWGRLFMKFRFGGVERE